MSNAARISNLKESFKKWLSTPRNATDSPEQGLFSAYLKDLKLYTNTFRQPERPFERTRTQRFLKKIYRNLNEFCNFSTFHGCKQLTARGRHPIEYLLWGGVMIYMVVATIQLSMRSWSRYQNFPTVIVMERNSRSWNVTFPTAMICPTKKVEKYKLEQLAEEYGVSNKTAFVEFFTALSISDFETFNYLPKPDYTEVPPRKYLDIIVRASSHFEHSVTSTLQTTQEDLDRVFTEFGICYAYNSKIAPFFKPLSLIGLKPPASKTLDLLYCNELDGEMFAGIIRYNDTFNASILGPFEMPIFGTQRTQMSRTGQTNLEIGCLPIVSTDAVRALSVEQRNCRTRSDGSLRVSRVYTYNLCQTECRLNYALKMCGCVPYTYYNIHAELRHENLPICDVPGMRCLAQNGSMLADLRDPVTNVRLPCDCLPLCTDFHFQILDKDDNLDEHMEGRFRWQMTSYPQTRYVRSILFDFTDFAVSVGATSGLFLGCSVLSFAELFYFFSVRLIVNKYQKWRKRRNGTLGKRQVPRRINRMYTEFIN